MLSGMRKHIEITKQLLEAGQGGGGSPEAVVEMFAERNAITNDLCAAVGLPLVDFDAAEVAGTVRGLARRRGSNEEVGCEEAGGEEAGGEEAGDKEAGCEGDGEEGDTEAQRRVWDIINAQLEAEREAEEAGDEEGEEEDSVEEFVEPVPSALAPQVDLEPAGCEDAGRVFTYVWGPVNTEACERWADRLAARQLRHGCLSFADLLALQAHRAQKLEGRPGKWSRDRFAEPRGPTSLGLRGALESSPDTDRADTELVEGPLVPGCLRGTSVFALPKLVRYVVRSGFGSELVQLDLVNSHFAQIRRNVDAARGCLELCRVVEDREAVLAEVGSALGLDRDGAKKLLLSLVYGASTRGLERAPFLLSLAGSIRKLAAGLGQEHPEKLRMLEEWGRKQPLVSLLSYLAGHWQREVVDRMLAAVPPGAGEVVSFERDGFVLWRPRGVESAVAEAAGMPVTAEAYPGADEELLAFAKRRYPFLDWHVFSRIPYKKVLEARVGCEAVVWGVTDDKGKLSFPTPQNVTDFSTVIAARLEPYVYVGCEELVEFYDRGESLYGYWKVAKKDRALKMLVREVLMEEFRRVGAQRGEGKVLGERRGEAGGGVGGSLRTGAAGGSFLVRNGRGESAGRGQVPPCCKRPGFRNSVADDVSLLLMRTPSRVLDADDTRRFLQDKEGRIYDFETDTFLPGCAGLRLARRLQWAFVKGEELGSPDEVWDAPPKVKQEFADILQQIFAYWRGGSGPKGKTLDDEPVFGAPLAERFRRFVRECPFTGYWRVMLEVYNMNVDEVLWKHLHLTADACAWARRCEWTYEYGAGNSGKDTSHSFSLNFFGNRAVGGFAVALPGSWFTSRHQIQPDAPSVTLNSCRYMRYMSNNEIPAHTWFNFDAVKPLCEQRGTWVVSRGLYQDCEPWRPMGGLHCTSNHPLVLTEEQAADSGNRRRLNYLRMPKVFLPGEEREVKDEINTGKFNGEIFWSCRLFYTHLKALGPSGRLEPRPPRVVAETDALFNRDLVTMVKDFLEAQTDPAPSYGQATPAAQCREYLQKRLSLGAEVKTVLQTAGVHERSNGTMRVLTYLYPSHGRPSGILLRLSEGQPN